MYYLYDIRTGEFKGQSPVKINQILIGCTDIKPNVIPGPYQALVFDRKLQKWILIDDYRGTWWHKYNPQETIVIDKLGEKVDLTKYTNKEPCQFCKWDDSQDKWVFDIEQYKTFAIKNCLTFIDQILSKDWILNTLNITLNLVNIYMTIIIDKDESKLEQLQEVRNTFSQLEKQISNIKLTINSCLKQIQNATSKKEIDTILESSKQVILKQVGGSNS